MIGFGSIDFVQKRRQLSKARTTYFACQGIAVIILLGRLLLSESPLGAQEASHDSMFRVISIGDFGFGSVIIDQNGIVRAVCTRGEELDATLAEIFSEDASDR